MFTGQKPRVNLAGFTLDDTSRDAQARIRGTQVPSERRFMAKQKSAKQKITFTLVAPHARSVQLAGQFTSWQEKPIALKKLKAGPWKAVVSLPAGRHPYRFLVDGQWCDDPGCAVREPNSFGTENCICVV